MTLEVKGVSRYYGKTLALEAVSLAVAPGEVVALMGANGSGKSTLNKIIAGLLHPDQGTVTVAGHPIGAEGVEARRALGYMPEFPFLYPYLSAREHIDLLVGLRGLGPESKEQGEKLLHLFDLSNAADQPVRGHSQGMARKLALSLALLGQPRLLLLDEPTNGLDPPSIRRVREVIEGLKERGRSVLVSTHVADFAQRCADTVAVLARGKVVAMGSVAELGAQAGVPGAPLEEVYFALVPAEAREVGEAL